LLSFALIPAFAQESAFQEIETRAKRTSFEETLDIREVKESSARDVGEALQKVDGVWKIRRGGIANDIVVRGFQQENVNVLIDGVRIYGACPNNMDPPAFHVDFAEVSEVEITKGAFDTRNQGSLGGVVNIINKTPAQGFRVTPNLSLGSFGFVNPSATVSFANDVVYVLAGQSYRRSDAFRDGRGRRFTELANYQAAAQGRQAFDVTTGWFKLGVVPRTNHRLDLAYTRQAGDETLYPYLQMDAVYDNADRASAAYSVVGLSGPVRQVRVQGYLTKVKHWMTDELRMSAAGAPRPFSMGTFAGTRALGGKAEAEVSGLTVGAEVYRRNWNGVTTMKSMTGYFDQASIPDVNFTFSGVFADYGRVFFDKLRLSAGARLDHAASKARSASVQSDLYWAYRGTRSLEAADTNPSAKASVAYSLPRGFEVFAGAGRTARLPDAHERYFGLRRMGSDWVGNPLLRPVRNTEADAGLVYRHRRLYLRPTLFYSRLQDNITPHNQARLNAAPGITNKFARSYENVDGKLYGGELTYNLGFTDRWMLFGGVSYTRGLKDLVPERRILDRDMAEVPPLKSRAGLRYGTKYFFLEAEAIASKAQRSVDNDLLELPTPGYAVMNVKGGIHTKKLTLSAGLDNVFDRYYYEMLSYIRDPFRSGAKVPEPGRSVFASVSYGF
jgi:iron complex outermembrane receptor protein